MIRILLVDDHPIVRDGLAAVLDDQPDLEVVGAVGAASEARVEVARLVPDVVLLDLEMPDEDGVAALPDLRNTCPTARILVFTAYETEQRVVGALRAGAAGYLLKGAAAAEIARAVRVVHAGGAYLEPRAARVALSALSAPPAPALSAREREVLRHVADGLPSKQIAVVLGIAERTVKFHLASLFQKLGADNRAQAVALAGQHDLL